MSQAPTSAADLTAGSDIAANGRLFARHLRAGNRSPNTIKSYLEAVTQLDAYLAEHGMPRAVAAVRREHVEAFIEDQLRRIKPTRSRSPSRQSSDRIAPSPAGRSGLRGS